ncbi:enoyl-CoA hydratase-related protein [Streptomonospora nanhaiensis]|uniref:enoyl-CoA hydratase-related protein n=1 Tax=Streptomonospora nanhaiensis TaxID=1323731 RepID=UPI001C39158E|nr:enoyl-CoA hydratase-related protein [Streptomonospora nanhaiensis]MBV2364754.1 enoyl-CoA hydratase/isomerase family protein [Streptomonospora nanhaiensis]MBV2366732.1 enoyl-CoA hydratase/isomerase family protein [Streptomonospora nanhaiensis]
MTEAPDPAGTARGAEDVKDGEDNEAVEGAEGTAEDPVLSDLDSGVLRLTLNRPDRLNAWTPAMADRLSALLRAADHDPQVRAVLITGAGRAFCAGADMAALSAISGREVRVDGRALALPAELRKPVIAALNGPAAGVGLVLALFADVRFAAADAKLTTSFSMRGLSAEYGAAWLLPRLVGRGRALDLLLSSRVVLGEEAARIGLVDFACPREDVVVDALDYARTLAASCSPWSMAVIKRQVLRAAQSDFATAADEAADLMAESFAGPDFAEGVGSYLDKRPPRFPGLPPRG